MISATMHYRLPTVADLCRSGRISSLEIVAAIDLYIRDATAAPYGFTSGYSLDVAAVAADVPRASETMAGLGRQDKAYRNTVAVMTVRPTAP
jgi:hypothetical protein